MPLPGVTKRCRAPPEPHPGVPSMPNHPFLSKKEPPILRIGLECVQQCITQMWHTLWRLTLSLNDWYDRLTGTCPALVTTGGQEVKVVKPAEVFDKHKRKEPSFGPPRPPPRPSQTDTTAAAAAGASTSGTAGVQASLPPRSSDAGVGAVYSVHLCLNMPSIKVG
eukprot:1158105-Pelagomonas_calceolata.AAC.10